MASHAPRPIHAFVAEVLSKGRCGIGVLFVDDRGHVLGRVRKALPHATRDRAVFHGILAALGAARRLATRRVVVHVDDPGIVAQINGAQPVAWDLIGPYLQVRALPHAYREARVGGGSSGLGARRHRARRGCVETGGKLRRRPAALDAARLLTLSVDRTRAAALDGDRVVRLR